MIHTTGNRWRFVVALVLGTSLYATASAEEIRGTVAGVDGNWLRISVSRAGGIRVGDRVTVGAEIPGLGLVLSPAEWRVRRIEGNTVHAEAERTPAALPQAGYLATVHTNVKDGDQPTVTPQKAAHPQMTLDRARLPPVAREGWIGVIPQEARRSVVRPGGTKRFEVPALALQVVFEGHPAARAGLMESDVVTAINGSLPLTDAGRYMAEKLERAIGRSIEVEYDRAGRTHKARVEVEAMPLDFPFVQGRIGYAYRNGHGVAPDPVLGFAWMLKAAEGGDAFAMLAVAESYRAGSEGQPADPEAAWRWVERAAAEGEGSAKGLLVLRRAGLDPFNPPPRKQLGATFKIRTGSMSPLHVDARPAPPIVDAVTPGGAAARAGLKAGDIVVSLNDLPITHFVELLEGLRTVPLHRPVPVVVLRAGRETRLTVSFDSVFEQPPR